MKMKKIKILVALALFSGIGFISFGFKEFNPNELPCEQNAKVDQLIRINFPIAQVNPFRNPTYEYYNPNPDLRNINPPLNPNLQRSDNYYCIVTVTSPRCAAFTWTSALELGINTASTDYATMRIKIPGQGFDYNINVEYYERGDGDGQPDFNKVPAQSPYYTFTKSRVKYAASKYYLGGGAPGAENIFLQPISNNGYLSQNEIISIGGKLASPDLSGINQYINLTK